MLHIFAPDEFDVRLYLLHSNDEIMHNSAHKRAVYYKNIISAFDIEASNLHDIGHSIMYLWQWCFDTNVVMGRTWNEFLLFRKRVEEALPDNYRLPVFVHNLSYEYFFLRGIWAFGEGDVFAVDLRKIVRAIMGKIEFRCSYYLTNKSLANFLKDTGVAHQKLSGSEFDYSIRRFPHTPLTEKEMEYGAVDVLGLCEAMRVQMKLHGDTLYTLPLTQTGYCRRMMRRVMEKYRRNGYLRNCYPDFSVYSLLREAFRGGNTHANRYAVGEVYSGKIVSFDRSSSYPDVLVHELYPTGRWKKETLLTPERVLTLIKQRRRALVMRVKLHNIEVHDTCTVPYLAVYKCRHLTGAVKDNGRVLSADYAETTVTDIDLMILISQYEFDLEILEMFSCSYSRLPSEYIEAIKELYHNKTSLKNVPEKEDEYKRSKEIINAVYGMSAQSPTKPDILLDEDTGDLFEDTETSDEGLYEEFQKTAFLPYSWGVWCTAWARYRLQEAIDIVEANPDAEMLYTDTDSVKYIGEVDFTELNRKLRERAVKSGAFADDTKGNRHFMGEWEADAIYSEFATLGAKKYCYRDMDGKLHVTVAGLVKYKEGKEISAIELEQVGGIDAFAEAAYSNIVFHESGGTEAHYNEHPNEKIEVDGHPYLITSNVYIKNSTYTLGVDADYIRFFTKSHSLAKSVARKMGLH